MGRFRIGKDVAKKTRNIPKVMKDIPNIVTIEDLEKRLSEIPVQKIETRIQQMPIEKTETIKEVVSIKTKDGRARQFAKLLKNKINSLEIINKNIDTKLEQISSKIQQIIKDSQNSRKIDQASLSSMALEIKQIQVDQLELKTEINKQIQELKKTKISPILATGVVISLLLNLLILIFN